ncbi:HD domain-containing protein [Flavobacterium sp.]|uniref:HD domain-containing protein n=1 Tax=Flavobacterium sp. TaxID=239 RepID=UPI004034606C
MLKETFTTLAGKYTADLALTAQLWHFIEGRYTGKGRHYHTLTHLENLLLELQSCESHVADMDSVLFALFYHDVIYKSTAKDNEEKSANTAVLALSGIGFPQEKIEKCSAIILATKSHALSPDNDTNLFTDTDLSILGSNWEEYSVYFKNVRKEYSIYPDFMYNPGRKKVLLHFLEMEHIFKTEFFRDKYEKKARENLRREIEIL